MSMYDINADGWLDSGVGDASGDGAADQNALDTTGEGVADTWLVDNDQDGFADGRAYDTSGDGIVDTADSDVNQDGVPEVRVVDANQDGLYEAAAAVAAVPATEVADPLAALAAEAEANDAATGAFGDDIMAILAMGHPGGGGEIPAAGGDVAEGLTRLDNAAANYAGTVPEGTAVEYDPYIGRNVYYEPGDATPDSQPDGRIDGY